MCSEKAVDKSINRSLVILLEAYRTRLLANINSGSEELEREMESLKTDRVALMDLVTKYRLQILDYETGTRGGGIVEGDELLIQQLALEKDQLRERLKEQARSNMEALERAEDCLRDSEMHLVKLRGMLQQQGKEGGDVVDLVQKENSAAVDVQKSNAMTMSKGEEEKVNLPQSSNIDTSQLDNENPITTITGMIVMKGVLLKQGRIMRNWKQRSFELRSQGLLQYFDDKHKNSITGKSRFKGEMQLGPYSTVEDMEWQATLSYSDKRYRYQIKINNDKRELLIAAKSAEVKRKWINALETVVNSLGSDNNAERNNTISKLETKSSVKMPLLFSFLSRRKGVEGGGGVVEEVMGGRLNFG